MVASIDAVVPDPAEYEADARGERSSVRCATWTCTPGTPLRDIRIDKVFIGSCTNARIEDLRAAARVADGRRVADGVHAIVVPGSAQVKRQAEEEGLREVFERAGFEWRRAGCSMCLGMNPDILQAGERCASTSNRNFEGRQGAGGRTHLLSPRWPSPLRSRGASRTSGSSHEAATFGNGSACRPRSSRCRHGPDHPEAVLKRIERSGYGEFLFFDWMQDPDFELRSQPRRIDPARGRNFGRGSSREHAAWALEDPASGGARAVVRRHLPADAINSGLAPVVVPADQLAHVKDAVAQRNELTVDLESLRIAHPDGLELTFELDAHARHTLVQVSTTWRGRFARGRDRRRRRTYVRRFDLAAPRVT